MRGIDLSTATSIDQLQSGDGAAFIVSAQDHAPDLVVVADGAGSPTRTSLGIGVIGTLIAVFAKGLPEVFAHITPWGYYSLAEAADYAGNEIVALPLSYPSIAALAVFGAALFLGITARFDRQEA